MKLLYLLRHAKSPQSIDVPTDMDRPLNERGYGDIQRIAKKVAAEKVRIDSIVSSPAIRAFSTALILARAIKYAEDRIVLNKRLFDSSAGDYIEVITSSEDSVNSLLIAGHNPAISDALNRLSRGEITEMPTSSLACLTFDTDSWQRIDKLPSEIKFFFHPDGIK